MLKERDLIKPLSTIGLISVSSTLYRNTEFRHLSKPDPVPLFAPDYDDNDTGARFTPPKHGIRTLYLAYSIQTANLEVEASLKTSDGKTVDASSVPLVTIPIEANVSSILDLTDPDILNALDSNYQELTGSWRYTRIFSEPPTQLLGRVCFVSGSIKGIKFCSSKDEPDGRCLAIFTDRLVKGVDSVKVKDDSGSLDQEIP